MKFVAQFFILISMCITNLSAQPPAHNPYFLGHSLINFDIPQMVKGLAANANIVGHSDAVTILNGGNLSSQWNNYQSAQGAQYPTELATGLHDVFVITEAIPLRNHIQFSDCHDYANRFHDLAQLHVPQCQTYIYETWHCLFSGTPGGCPWDPNSENTAWRTRLTNDLPLWEGIANSVNTTTVGPNMLIVPGGQGMAKLYDEIQAGQFLPEYDNINDFFYDDIHTNSIGNYFIALIMYATIYKTSPVGLTNQLYNQYGTAYAAPTPPIATKLQQIAWNVVCGYPKSGVNCGVLNASNLLNYFEGSLKNNGTQLNWKINPQNNLLHIEVEKSTTGNSFSIISKVNQTVNNEYSFFDGNINAEPKTYYRLKFVYTNGKYNYSNVILIQLKVETNLILSGNPVTTSLSISGLKSNGQITITDMNGKQLLQKSITAQTITLDIKFLPKGFYILQYFDGVNTVTKKFTKQ
jgi:Secretion system C-terminal sorting domain